MVTARPGSGPSPAAAAPGTEASREKRWVALTSVGAAVVLTSTKLLVGLTTGSLGLLAEAAHSGLDLIASVMTYFAVRISDKPADAEHPYGHGKVENLSALGETVLLLVTCVWIVREAILRLFFKDVPVEATMWSFAVILISILIDVSRSRALQRVAQKHNSQALEADALHFSTDVWSSAVVLLGLILVKVGAATGQASLWQRADAGAALIVAGLVVGVSVKLGRRTIDVLIDRAPAGMRQAIDQAVRQVAGVMDCQQIRLRQSGNQTFVDLVIGVKRGTSLESSHAIADAVEARVKAQWPGADVVVHIDPRAGADETLAGRISAIAGNQGQTVHHVVITGEGERVNVELHLEAPETLELQQAHDQAHGLEAAIRAELPQIATITTHIEPARIPQEGLRDVTDASASLVQRVRQIAAATPGIVECHAVIVRQAGQQVFLTMHCSFAAGAAVRDVHDTSSKLERRLRDAIPELTRATIHPEPFVREPGDTTTGDD